VEYREGGGYKVRGRGVDLGDTWRREIMGGRGRGRERGIVLECDMEGEGDRERERGE
jgi:hypothetical protein